MSSGCIREIASPFPFLSTMLSKFSLVLCLGLVICGYVTSSPEIESNPFLEAAKSFLQEAVEKNPEIGKNAGIAALGGIFQTIQNADGKQIGDILSSFTAASGTNNVAGDILSGIAGMLGKNSPNFDPKIVGQVAEILSNLGGDGKNHNAAIDTNEIPDQRDAGPDWGAVLGLASNFISSVNTADKSGEGGGGLDALLNLLPLLTGSAPSGHVHFADADLEDANEHQKHEQSGFMPPPFMRIVYEYWDHFKKSEFGETVWRKSGLEAIFQLFVNQDGYFQVDRIFESMENTSFRRKWIKSLSSFVGEWFKHLSDPVTQARYVANLKYVGNTFLKAQGYSKSVYFDPTRPTDSFILITDAIFKRHFGLKVNSGKYVRPAVLYVQDLFRLGDSKNLFSVSHLSSQDISNKLTELLNGELIEPILRVWKAYKYSIKHPQCDKRLICFLNDAKENSRAKTGLKPGVVKLSSLIASWYMSGRTGTPFWKLYNAATEDHICEVQYPADCQSFFEDDLRFTTESTHDGEEL